MNHVYRLIWNTSLGCWMVASEHTCSHGKRSSTARGLVAAVVLALSMPVVAADALDTPVEDAIEVLDESDDRVPGTAPLNVRKEQIALFGNALPRSSATNAAPLALNRSLQATVNDTYFAIPTLSGENALVLGSRASVTGNRSTGIGNEVVLNGGGHTALGSKATATGGMDAVAIGINAVTNGTGHVAIGEAARADTNGAGVHAVAIGAHARAGSSGWTGATAVGGEAVAAYNGVALGYKTSAQHAGALALGFNSIAGNSYANAIGYQAQAAGGSAVAIGTLAKSAGSASLAFGERAQTSATANDSIAIGNGAQATYAQAIAIGRLAKGYGTGAVVLGNEAHALGYSNAIGHEANANNSWANAIGFQAKALGAGSSAIGYKANAGSLATVAIGWEAKANAVYSIAQGYMAEVNATAADGIALGKDSKVGANAAQALAVGMAAQATGASSIALGHQAQAVHASSIALGTQANATGNQSLAVGLRAKANGQTAMVLGMDAQALGNYTTAVGHQAKAGSAWTNAIGYQSEAMGSSSVALGTLAKSAASGSIAVGDRSKVDATAASSLALGHYATVNAGAANAVALGSSSVATVANTVSVGSTSVKRKIVNLADGEVSATSTDAVTGKQLFAVNNRFNGQSIALGENAQTLGGRAIAIGYNALVPTNGGVDGIAIGTNARGGSAGYSGGMAVGSGATADYNGVALGYYAQASAGGAVALGANSIANVANAVSVGNDSLKRKIVNVADGALSAASTEAVTGKQLFATNQNVTAATNTANTAKTTADAAKVDATAALNKANLVSGLIGQVSAAGNVRVGAENTGTVLDVRNKANTNRTVGGVADGALSATSAEAVTGKQLFATNQNVTTATNTANTAKTTADAAKVDAIAALDKATVVSGLIGQAAPNGAMRLGAENTGMALDVRNKHNGNRIVTGVSDGTLDVSSSEAVNGRQLNNTNLLVTANSVAIADNRRDIGVNRGDLDTLREDFDNYTPDLSGVVQYNADRTLVDLGGAGVTGLADGEISATSTDAVNGSQLFGTNGRVEYLEQQQRYVMVGGDEFSGPAMAGPLAVAIGSDAKAPVDGATAIGSFASAQAVNSVALGRGALVRAAAEAGFALGTNTEVAAAGGLAVGALSSVGAGANRAVALGNESVANESDTISVGNDNLKRRIVNVGRGTAEADVTTVAQLSETLTALGGGAGLDATGVVIAPNYVLSGGEFNNVGDALASLDTTLISHKSDLDTLDNRFQRLFQESPSASADAPGRLTLGGAQGMVLGNVANGLIGQGSRDAVNGGQLWAVKQDLQGQIDALDPNGQGANAVAMNARSAAVASDTPPAPEAGTTPPAPEAVVTAEGDNAVAVGSEGKERTVKHVAEGRADTDAANVRQVNEAMERANEYTDAAVAGVNQRLDHMDKRINRMAAISSAQSAMAMNTAGLATTNRLGAGVGYSEGESALSVGYQRVLNQRGSATFSLNGAFTNSGERSVGVGMGIGW